MLLRVELNLKLLNHVDLFSDYHDPDSGDFRVMVLPVAYSPLAGDVAYEPSTHKCTHLHNLIAQLGTHRHK